MAPTPLKAVEVLPGLVLLLYPCENVDEIGSQLSAFFDEVERRPGLGDELTEDEIAALWEPEDSEDGTTE